MRFYDQFNRPMDFSGPANREQFGHLLETVADRERAGDYLSGFLGLLPDPDPILRKMEDGASILADLEADDQVTARMMARKNPVLNKQNYAFKPGALKGETPTLAAKLLCDRLVNDLENLTMRDVISDIIDAPFHGFSAMEITWEVRDGWWHVAGFEAKPQEWFGFDEQNRLVFKGAYSLTPQPVPDGKFVLIRHFSTYKNPYGLRLLSRCLWPVAFKKGGLSFYTRFLEKYGTPWPIGTAPSKATQEEMDRMALNLSRMVRDAAAVIPYGAKVELATPTGNTGELHEVYLKRQDAAISKVLTGNTLTSEVGDHGSYAASKTHKDVADEYTATDMDLTVTGLNELAWIYTRLNVGKSEMSPLFAYEEPEDLAQAADLDGKLTSMGVRFNAKHFQNKYSLAEDEFEMATPAALPASGAYEFAAPGGQADPYQDAIEEAVKQYAPKAAEAGEMFFSQVWKIIDEAESFEDIERELAELMGEKAGPGELAELLEELMINAGLMGRFFEDEKRRGRA